MKILSGFFCNADESPLDFHPCFRKKVAGSPAPEYLPVMNPGLALAGRAAEKGAGVWGEELGGRYAGLIRSFAGS